jgi:hypothetical protein
MRMFVVLALLSAAPAIAQMEVNRTVVSPAADYITAGQDESGYRLWALADPTRPAAVAAYYAFLVRRGVAGIVPTWQLLRTATDWQKCAAQPFEVPPAEQWPHIVETLDYVRAHVVPVIGPVEPVSVYRNPLLNACAHGAPESAHALLYAMDLVPLRPIGRDGLIRSLCAIHLWRGTGFDVGLGFYNGLRFHVDSKKFRKWGGDGKGESSPCAAVIGELPGAG